MLIADLSLFFGRFHPVVVHLPIGFLLLAAVLEFWPGKRMSKAASISWGVGAASAVVAALLGWLLAGDGSFDDAAVFWHKWLGIGVAALSVGGFFLTRKTRPINKIVAAVIVGLLLFTGHLGGNLTHGESYLFDYAPEFVRNAAGFETGAQGVDWKSIDADSILVYNDLIEPMLTSHCIQCHGQNKQNGGLRMDEPHYLFDGGDSGPLFAVGSSGNSEWVRRLTLPRHNPKSMPPKGASVSYTDIELIKHWIDGGADSTTYLKPENIDNELKKLMLRDYGLDLSPKTFVEKLKVDPVAESLLAELKSAGWAITSLSPDSGVLDAKPSPGGKINVAALELLVKHAGDQVAYLSLENQQLGGAYSTITGFRNLNRLKLNGSDVSTEEVLELSECRQLESLNLYATATTDAALQVVDFLTRLKRLYLWQTKVSEEAVAALAAERPQLEINTGFNFTDNTGSSADTETN